jgi:hypothetical protein
MQQAASTSPNPLDSSGLCLLSLDGGGVRGLSTLYILKGIMDRLKHERKQTANVKPCEVFDLIGGTSTGGYVDRSVVSSERFLTCPRKPDCDNAWPARNGC